MVRHEDALQAAFRQVESDRVVERLWRRDPTLWPEPSPGAAPATDRLGWLALPDALPGLTSEAAAFAADAIGSGFQDAVLLGMGGSSLAPEVMGSILGNSPGALRLHVLDSTVPAQITAVQKRLDITKTLFLISSKSGTTIEPLSLYSHFRTALEEAGVDSPGGHFAAITDPGTPLEDLARKQGFRRVFLGQTDVGGRFSALSSFGVVPAALIGAPLDALVDASRAMARACRRAGPGNPGVQLGAFLGGLCAQGRDKVTLILSSELQRLGLWIEQLLAESTGKVGKGLIPVSGEPPYDPAAYGPDRQFVYVRLAGSGDAASDAHAAALQQAGAPVTRLDMPDRSALWSEFFRWEFAVAVASALIGVHPFDEPDVNLAKEKARSALGRPAAAGKGTDALPEETAEAAVGKLLSQTREGDYLAIAAFLPETEGLTEAIGELRAAVTARTGIATTFGYGPRYLHSTGQLHKGGPGSVSVLLLTAADPAALPIPGEQHGFEALAAAQAAGDLDALRSLGRRAALASLGGDYAATVRCLAASVTG